MGAVMTLEKCKRQLVVLWFSGSAVLFLITLATTTFGFYRELEADTWGWLFANILPTLSLMVSVLVTGARQNDAAETANMFVFRLAFWLSLAYMMLLLFTMLVPVVNSTRQPYTAQAPVIFVKQAQQLYLAPIQGLVAGLLGAFFFKS
jgi:hypothetical protein